MTTESDSKNPTTAEAGLPRLPLLLGHSHPLTASQRRQPVGSGGRHPDVVVRGPLKRPDSSLSETTSPGAAATASNELDAAVSV